MGGRNSTLSEAKPFLKWAGSKKWLIPHIHKFIPKKYNRYFEPFLGSGAVFFALKPDCAFLSDLNENIINTYKALRDYPEKIIRRLKEMPYDKDFYYYIRDDYKPRSPVGAASRILYLNRTCWNGLYRENSSGKFNVPFGRFTNPKICNAENLRAVAKALKKVNIRSCNFKEVVKTAREGDFVFFDPPYITGRSNNGFHAYNEKLFKWKDQERLAEVAHDLKKRGCYVLVTNADNEDIWKLYEGFDIDHLPRQSVIAADVKNRRMVYELIISGA